MPLYLFSPIPFLICFRKHTFLYLYGVICKQSNFKSDSRSTLYFPCVTFKNLFLFSIEFSWIGGKNTSAHNAPSIPKNDFLDAGANLQYYPSVE